MGTKWSVAAGVLMVLVGVVLFVVFRGVETPVAGLRQVGVVLFVIGVVELVALGYARVRGFGRC
ncbi:hypothetical protein NDR87_10180 [Nocardia sp. CDC159]|uniref:Uncharacterized protein n=1 Tax=Nocardia pulmonis TaxID=2951408 RepID=A0A9X2E6Q7_9NOCA|nr:MULTISPECIES: hypothetical protein [Nocardia]MCM6773835.1 hypothetical protein [Nocardia pulmonis]MCM6786722.1 hypothetical protein [Nocardia sp. CDC159]